MRRLMLAFMRELWDIAWRGALIGGLCALFVFWFTEAAHVFDHTTTTTTTTTTEYDVSAFMHAGSADEVLVSAADGGARFDIVACTLIDAWGLNTHAVVESFGDGWCKVQLRTTAPGTVRIVPNVGDVSRWGMFIDDVDAHPGPR